jgi:hypothetical protein
MRCSWPGSPVQKGATPASFRTTVNIILFWDNPMMGSAYPADDISHPRYRQIRPFTRPGRLLRADGRARKATGLTQHALALRLKKPQSFVAKYEGGERRLDVVEFITIARALGADPLKLMTTLLSGGKGKSPRAKRDA